MLPPEKPSDDPTHDRWKDYFERYDRYLKLKERSLDQGDEYNRLLSENNRMQDAAQQRYERQVQQQRQIAKWAFILVMLIILILSMVVLVANYIKSNSVRSPVVHFIISPFHSPHDGPNVVVQQRDYKRERPGEYAVAIG